MPAPMRDEDNPTVADRLPVLPLRDVVLFPHSVMPLLVGRSASLAAVEAAVAADGMLLLVAQRDGDVAEPAAGDLYRVGVACRLIQASRQQNATKVLVEGISRVRITRYATSAGSLRAAVTPFPFEPSIAAGAEDEAAARRAIGLFEEFVGLHRRMPPEVLQLVHGTESPERQAWAIAAHLAVRTETRQAMLEATTLADLWERLSEVLDAELEILRLERKIDDDVRGTLFRNQREFYLQEQLKVIHRELGAQDDADEIEAQLAERQMPEPVRARATRELRRLRGMSPMSPESTVARGFLDWVIALPWSETSEDTIDVAHARTVLDEDHYGLEEVKDRILDYIAVLALAKRLDAPILCLVGPPGVGKTSLGRSIARALGRKFVRMALGGVRDEAEIRGHRRTYIGAMPGRVLQAMRRAEVVNPVLLLDEVDKLGSDPLRGDPSSALLEVLDPEQNATFSDHYLEVEYDLSRVLFVTTANSLAGIPEPLRDRLEIIRLPGYLDHEKLAISRGFLVPRQLERHGLAPDSVQWDDDVLPTIVRHWTREAGVRELERRIGRVARKLARRRVELNAAAPQRVTAADLTELLGTAPYDPDKVGREDRVGVANGLAYTTVGGELLDVEVSAVPGRGRLNLTGALGDVMKESASAAMSYIRSRAASLGLPSDFYRSRDIHVHIPSGATPKDGPSAGVAIAVAIISALTGAPIRGDVAMTGEITLRGRVLAIGGLKEKSVAARRHGITDVVIPADNARELSDLPAEVRASVRFHPVETMDEVMPLVFRQLPSGMLAAARREAVLGAPLTH